MDRKSLLERIAAMGMELTPDMIGGTLGLYAPFALKPDEDRVTRDIAYGPDERHKLDVFHAEPRGESAPVVLFIHGGGFVMGDKGKAGDPFHNNIGAWAARAGFVGATMTYRLAPAHRWPAGSEDVASAVRWLKANVAQYGGDPQRIFVMGTSAGAVHVAGLVAEPALRAGAEIAGALMISGLYDYTRTAPSPNHDAYYGDNGAVLPGRSTLAGLVKSDVPCFYTVAEYDPADFQTQAAHLVQAHIEANGRWPEMHMLAGTNHISSTSQIGTDHDALGPLVEAFIRRVG